MSGNGSSRQNKIRIYATLSDFPAIGKKGVWYFDRSTGIAYFWNGLAYQASGQLIKSVKDYGAVGDGVADDTAAFQAAIDDIDTVLEREAGKYIINTGAMFIPAGRYKITDEITIPAGIFLFGESRGSVLIKHEPVSAKNCFYFVDDPVLGNSITSQIARVSIQGDGVNSQYGITGENLSFNCIIEEVGTFGFVDGIRIDGAVTLTVRDSTSSDNSAYGLHLMNPSVANIKNNRFEDNNVGCYLTNSLSFPFVGGTKYTHNIHQRNNLQGLLVENWTDGVFEHNDFEKNNISNTPDTGYFDITGRFNPYLNISALMNNNRFYEDDIAAGSVAIKITNVKKPGGDRNTYEGFFKYRRVTTGINATEDEDGVVRGDYMPSFTNEVVQKRIDGSTLTTLDVFGAPDTLLEKTEPGIDFPGGTNDNISFNSAMTLNTSLSLVTPKFLVPDAAPADYQGIMAVSDRYNDVYNANSILIRINSSGAGGGLDFLLWDSGGTLYNITAYSDFVSDFNGTYVRIMATIDRSTSPATLKVYINDVAVYENQSANWASDITPDYTHLGLGSVTTRTYNGTMIGGAYVFKSALSQEEITEFYENNEKWSSYSTSPEFYAPLDEYAGTVIKDQSGNGYDGTFRNNIAWNTEYKRTEDNAVHKVGDESIAGNKTFLDKIILGTNGEISDDSGDTLEENTSATNGFITKFGDALGVAKRYFKNSSDAVVAFIDSFGSGIFGIGQDSVISVATALSVVTAKINSVGASFINGGYFGLGTATPQAQLDLQGSKIEKTTQATSDTDYTVLSTDYHVEAYAVTKTVYVDLPSLSSTPKDRIIPVTNHGGSGNNVVARANGSDLFYNGTANSSNIGNGSTINVKNFGTFWDEV